MFIVLVQKVFLRITSTGHLPAEVYSAPGFAVEVEIEVGLGTEIEVGAGL